MSNIAIIGGGPAGVFSAITAKRNNPKHNIIIFEKKDIVSTLLPTGGGRCNLTFADKDIKSFAQNYPRGEKFLYSVFNQFFVDDTIDFFKNIGLKTYIQDDLRVFPTTNKSLDVIFALKNEVKRLGIKVQKEEVKELKKVENGYVVNGKTFDKIVFSIGGRRSPLMKCIEDIGHTVIKQKPALCGLKIAETYFSEISGVSLKNLNATISYLSKNKNLTGDILFTHKGISGPLAYKISSVYSTENYVQNEPIKLFLHFVNNEKFNLQTLLNENSKKEIINLVTDFMPKSMAKLVLERNNIDIEKRCHQIQKDERKIIEKILTEFQITVVAPIMEEEIVASGGISLKEINAKTMMSKVAENLFFCGEVIDVDGFCGGFNLQNCWSTGYIAGMNL